VASIEGGVLGEGASPGDKKSLQRGRGSKDARCPSRLVRGGGNVKEGNGCTSPRRSDTGERTHAIQKSDMALPGNKIDQNASAQLEWSPSEKREGGRCFRGGGLGWGGTKRNARGS